MCLPTVGGAAGSLASYAPGGLDPGDNGVVIPGLDPSAPRRIRIYNHRSNDRIDVEYFAGGAYVSSAVQEFSYFMRDWRNNKTIGIDNRTVDIMTAAHNLMGTSEPYMLLSGYRSPETNAMLRSRSSGVARNSLHLRGQAADLRLQSRSVNQMARAASACAAGGVGRYSSSDFVHMDCGAVRNWGR